MNKLQKKKAARKLRKNLTIYQYNKNKVTAYKKYLTSLREK